MVLPNDVAVHDQGPTVPLKSQRAAWHVMAISLGEVVAKSQVQVSGVCEIKMSLQGTASHVSLLPSEK